MEQQTVTILIETPNDAEMEYWAALVDQQLTVVRAALKRQKQAALERGDRQDVDDVYVGVEWNRVDTGLFSR